MPEQSKSNEIHLNKKTNEKKINKNSFGHFKYYDFKYKCPRNIPC